MMVSVISVLVGIIVLSLLKLPNQGKPVDKAFD
jgi:hypothetical protein